MEQFNRKAHWETIFSQKKPDEVSWFQKSQENSLNLIQKLNVSLDAKIIDVGGGDSFLAEELLKVGFKNITVLDISNEAIVRAKKRIGEDASKITWIVSDILDFESNESYDIWFDRAVFHFLTQDEEIEIYKSKASNFISEKGNLIVGTFSQNGPLKCSGIEIKQYSEASLEQTFSENFKKIVSFSADHQTPFDTTQNFVFCTFEKK